MLSLEEPDGTEPGWDSHLYLLVTAVVARCLSSPAAGACVEGGQGVCTQSAVITGGLCWAPQTLGCVGLSPPGGPGLLLTLPPSVSHKAMIGSRLQMLAPPRVILDGLSRPQVVRCVACFLLALMACESLEGLRKSPQGWTGAAARRQSGAARALSPAGVAPAGRARPAGPRCSTLGVPGAVRVGREDPLWLPSLGGAVVAAQDPNASWKPPGWGGVTHPSEPFTLRQPQSFS